MVLKGLSFFWNGMSFLCCLLLKVHLMSFYDVLVFSKWHNDPVFVRSFPLLTFMGCRTCSQLTTQIDFFVQFWPWNTISSVQRIGGMETRETWSLTVTSQATLLRMPCCFGLRLPLNWHMNWQAILSYGTFLLNHMKSELSRLPSISVIPWISLRSRIQGFGKDSTLLTNLLFLGYGSTSWWYVSDFDMLCLCKEQQIKRRLLLWANASVPPGRHNQVNVHAVGGFDGVFLYHGCFASACLGLNFYPLESLFCIGVFTVLNSHMSCLGSR